MALTKNVNGNIVELSPEEEATVLAQWEAGAIPPVPSAVTPAQLRLALDAVDMLDAVEAVVDQLGRAARIKWDFGIIIPRNDPLVIAAAQQLNWTDAQVDDLFRAAAQN